MKILEKHAFSLLGQPYIWGGDDPSGFDCSGLVIELEQGCGMLPRTMKNAKGQTVPFDATSHQLYKKYESEGVINSKGFGALAFFGTKTKVIHVGFMIDNFRMIEAGGGGRHVKTLEDAIKYNAFIRIRPITWRSDIVEIIKPRYPTFN